MRARSSWLFHCPIKRDAWSRLAPPANRHEQAKEIPFTVEQFFGIFAEYNSAVRPAQVPLNGMALAALGLVFVRCHWSGAAVSAILAMLSAQPTGGAHAAVFRQRPGRIPAGGTARPGACRRRRGRNLAVGLGTTQAAGRTAGRERERMNHIRRAYRYAAPRRRLQAPRARHGAVIQGLPSPSAATCHAALPGSATARTLLAAMSAVRLSAN